MAEPAPGLTFQSFPSCVVIAGIGLYCQGFVSTGPVVSPALLHSPSGSRGRRWREGLSGYEHVWIPACTKAFPGSGRVGSSWAVCRKAEVIQALPGLFQGSSVVIRVTCCYVTSYRLISQHSHGGLVSLFWYCPDPSLKSWWWESQGGPALPVSQDVYWLPWGLPQCPSGWSCGGLRLKYRLNTIGCGSPLLPLSFPILMYPFNWSQEDWPVHLLGLDSTSSLGALSSWPAHWFLVFGALQTPCSAAVSVPFSSCYTVHLLIGWLYFYFFLFWEALSSLQTLVACDRPEFRLILSRPTPQLPYI